MSNPISPRSNLWRHRHGPWKSLVRIIRCRNCGSNESGGAWFAQGMEAHVAGFLCLPCHDARMEYENLLAVGRAWARTVDETCELLF